MRLLEDLSCYRGSLFTQLKQIFDLSRLHSHLDLLIKAIQELKIHLTAKYLTSKRGHIALVSHNLWKISLLHGKVGVQGIDVHELFGFFTLNIDNLLLSRLGKLLDLLEEFSVSLALLQSGFRLQIHLAELVKLWIESNHQGLDSHIVLHMAKVLINLRVH